MTENSLNNAVTMRPQTGASLGRIDQYELIRELGGGGFGCVYLAKDTVAGIDVAVKGLPPLVRLNKEELENVRKNFALVSRLHHPNIAAALTLHPVTNAFYNDKTDAEKLRVFNGDTLVVMQYAPGVTLSQWRKQFSDCKVPLDKALEITRQIASALDYAHEEKILHRDIKPANVMIETGPDGKIVARVLDFGLAAEIRSSMSRVSQSITDTSGTRPYMAPEQWGGRKQGKETDLYSLAVLFYELVSGEVPFASVFDTGDPVLMMNVIETKNPELSSELSKPIRLALTKALSKKREDRFGSCSEFIDALVGCGAVTAPYGKAFGKIAAVGLLVLGLAGGVWYWQDAKAKEEARIVAEQKAEAERKQKEEAARIAAEKVKAEAEEKAREEAARIAVEKTTAKINENTRLAIEAFEAERWEDGFRLSKSADLNDKMIQFYLGWMYDNGHSVPKDESEAVKWYRKSAEQGLAEAQCNLGVMYESGCGVAKDYYEAVKWCRKSAEQGNASAQNWLGWMYQNGRGVTKDDYEAVKWYRKAAEQGLAEAQFNLGLMYENGRGVEKDDHEAVKWCRKSAEQGLAAAQFNLGWMYENGRGVEKDDYEAVKWYRKSAERGNATAQNNLGVMYESGCGVAKDYYEAVKWFRKSAEQGNASAQNWLGWMYDEGRGVTKDEREAVKWYRKSAEQGLAAAQFNLGMMYNNGNGVEKDYSEAVKWYRKSAEQGNATAQFNLGMMYQNGRGVTKDKYEAVKWYCKSAVHGYETAQFLLGSMYEGGVGVAKDEREAVKWYRKSAEQGNADAKAALKRLGY